jgi:hypothetical protein
MKENLELKFSVVIRSITVVDDAFCLSAGPMLMHTCMLGGRQAAGMIYGRPCSTWIAMMVLRSPGPTMLPFMAGVDDAGTLIAFFRSSDFQTVSIRSARDQGRASRAVIGRE